MKDEELLCLAAEYIHHEDDRLRRQAEKAWDIITLKSERIEENAFRGDMTASGEEMSSGKLLKELLAQIEGIQN